MFIAMNRFKVVKGSEADFEEVWTSRQTRLGEMPGFLSFHLLKGPEKDDHTLYTSHSTWSSKDLFLEWTRSEQFRSAHKNAGQTRSHYLGPPEFEGYEAVLSEYAETGAKVAPEPA